MAGYSGQSKSNNAIDAEDAGRFPASVCDKRLGCKPGATAALIRTDEWHHSSKNFNRVSYYDISELDADTLAALRAWRPAPSTASVTEGAVVEWIEWSGSLKRPHATPCRIEGARVVVKGVTATVYPLTGAPFAKRLATRGFSFTAAR